MDYSTAYYYYYYYRLKTPCLNHVSQRYVFYNSEFFRF